MNELINEDIKITKQVSTIPSSVRIIKKGNLFKMGGNRKNWKNRVFVASNKVDNYLISYYSDVECTDCKGSFSCCGYYVIDFTEDDDILYGKYGFYIKPYDCSKRTYIVRADNKLDKKEWIETFNNACVKTEAINTLDYDIDMNKAFLLTYESIREIYGYFGYYKISGMEIEKLYCLVISILNKEIVDSLILKMTYNYELSKKKEIIHSIYLQIDSIIKPIINSTLRNSKQSVKVMEAGNIFLSFYLFFYY